MRVWCVGAGAVGGCVAARLQRAGVDVFVIDANDEHVRIISRIRTACRWPRRRREDDAPRASAPGRTGDPDVVLLGGALRIDRRRARAIATLIGSTTDVVSLQNGLNEDRIAAVVGADRTIGCVVGFGATWIGPGHISLDANGDLTIGRLDGTTDVRLGSAARAAREQAFPTKITDNIRGALWAKMLVNSMTVLGALGGMLTGDSSSTREAASPCRAMSSPRASASREPKASSCRTCSGWCRRPPSTRRQWHTLMDRALIRVGEAFGAIKSVTWRDFELGRKTEIDAVTGEIVREAIRRPFLSHLLVPVSCSTL